MDVALVLDTSSSRVFLPWTPVSLKRLIMEALHVAQHEASTRQRKADTRAKII